LEVNKEIEFEVSDGNSFLNMLEGLGFELSLKKHKKTKSYHYKEFHIELVEIESLGNFVEIETLQEDENPETVKRLQNALYEVLEKCGISKDAVEKRYYSELLRQQAKK
ncbi:MAG: class IV adenylate cyclase, partial [Spirochaetaceae bacterium]|nr:class IV adenylate cyclase [Spirochaetaceae bacterium]